MILHGQAFFYPSVSTFIIASDKFCPHISIIKKAGAVHWLEEYCFPWHGSAPAAFVFLLTNGAFAKSPSDVLDSVLQKNTAIPFLMIHEHRELLCIFLRYQINTANRDSSNWFIPPIPLHKKMKARSGDFVGELRSEWELTLVFTQMKRQALPN